MTSKRIIWLFFCAAFIIVLFSIYAASQKKKQTPVIETTRTITDMKGRTFEVADPLERIALLGGPTGQIAFILGVQDRLCAVTNTLKMSALVKTFFPQISDLPGPRTTSGSINIEELIKSDPDIAIAGDIDGGIVLEKTRIPVAFLEDSMGEGLEDIKKDVRFYGVVFNTPDRAERYVAYLERFTALVLERTRDIPKDQRKKVFQGYNPSHLVTLGGDTFMQERIEIAGCLNAAQSVTTIGQRTGLHSGLGEVSMEQVLAWNPDILVINYGTPDDVYADPRWQQIKAVADRQVYPQPAGVFIFNRPTAESAALFPLWLAGIAYPDKFSDVCIPCLVKEFYGEVFGFDLTDPQVTRILAGMMVGGALAVSGSSFQGVFQNPLVSPHILGVAAGAGFGAALAILLFDNIWLIHLTSFVFGLAAVGMAYALSRVYKMTPVLMLVLSGIVVGSLFSALTSFLKYIADPMNKMPAIVFWLLEPNGSGKSTLLKCIMQVLTPNAGRVAVDGQNLNGLSASQIASKLGFVPQSLVSAFPFTVAEIVVMGRASQIRMTASPSKKDRDLAMAALERMGIARLALRPCNQLSGGEWQQVLIARALTHSPHVLLLDEPTSHLDIGNQVKILEIVNRLARDGITILMASHFPDHAFLTAHQVGILKNGRLLALGNPDDTLSESVLYDTYGMHIRVVTVEEDIHRKICIPVLSENNRPAASRKAS